ncbi:hypothetical protein SLEP1_g27269 [Rubroshorea leprosula]|uniref:Uncharacterized protein n=1 Tax=Rubroshorea leprosula TaxID=152421 RepID=A0AAV5JWY8_9ROSI|nr:hypothetical protein SLEP1_g27269 [Rubroshorea leprosula]
MNSLVFQSLQSTSRTSSTPHIIPMTQTSRMRCITPLVHMSYCNASPLRLPSLCMSYGSRSSPHLLSLNSSNHNDQWENWKQQILEILLACKKVYDMAANVVDIRTTLTKPIPLPLLAKPAINMEMYWFEWLIDPKKVGVVNKGFFFEVDDETPKVCVIQTRFGSWYKTRTVHLNAEGRGEKFLPKLPVFDPIIYTQWLQEKSLEVVSIGLTGDDVVTKITFSRKITISNPFIVKSFGISQPTSFPYTSLRFLSLANIGELLASELDAENLANRIEHLFNATMVNIGTKICDLKVSIDAIHGLGTEVNYTALDSTNYE